MYKFDRILEEGNRPLFDLFDQKAIGYVFLMCCIIILKIWYVFVPFVYDQISVGSSDSNCTINHNRNGERDIF